MISYNNNNTIGTILLYYVGTCLSNFMNQGYKWKQTNGVWLLFSVKANSHFTKVYIQVVYIAVYRDYQLFINI